ncbi:Phosphatidate cytidylyltransferase, photoreceptor-specific [Hypsibius exemplaris]|uniref:Phosphatidate cytidylyltransferase n=1 Tax=Hypsibius exemplaris TaxID=2072580 RepID=A0A1W0W8D7_HYPEX|nr:Phosphatidate cytidylyltransferase, photoreceptor-specific [Hypsibius exemplaris]
MAEGDVRRRLTEKEPAARQISSGGDSRRLLEAPQAAEAVGKDVDSAEEDNTNVEEFESGMEADEQLRNLSQAKDTEIEAELGRRGFSSRARNWIVRFIFTVFMIVMFSFLVSLGPLALIALVLLIQIRCFQEIINIGYCIYKTQNLPWFRSLSWYFLLASNYFYYGENMIDYFGVFLSKTDFLQPFVTYHRFISFVLYCLGIVWFVLSLRKHYYFRQFSMFAWTHITLLIVNSAAFFFVQNIFQGLIWFLVPVSMIICNDIMAYMFGFFFGKTPLIKLSPKKTWEGFIGGGFSTVVFGILVHVIGDDPNSLLHLSVEYNEDEVRLATDCTPGYQFQLQQYTLPKLLQLIGFKHIKMYPFVWHSLSLSLFSSVIGPFGGFFASGFKRAFKIKDFGDMIPGHGGIMDRFDCQILMACFVNVYIRSFIRVANPNAMMSQIMRMESEDQVTLFNSLKNYLGSHGLLPIEQAPIGAT